MIRLYPIKSLEFEGSFPTSPALEPMPEIAFVGRSNVGKSSAINTLLNRRGAARVSRQPGRTQLINCFQLNGEVRIVDLPGYGFAKVPLSVKAKWERMIDGYLSARPQLALVVVLVDVRHSAQNLDLRMLSYLQQLGIPYAVVATKSDKLKNKALQKQKRSLREGLAIGRECPFQIFSSKDRVGVTEVWAVLQRAIDEYLRAEQDSESSS